ncbi:MAG: amylo-alpha-1,6-glucosidase [Candidatus Jacksonbacteria bacterium]
MKLKHFFSNSQQIQKNVQTRSGFLLTNQLGGYLWLDDEPRSRYQGWFFTPPDLAGRKIFKVIEDIRLSSSNKVTGLCNNFWNAERNRGKIKESFFMPCFFNALVYNVNQPQNIEIVLDIKESYDNREDGRDYKIEREGNFIIVKYYQTGGEFPPIFLAIRADFRRMRKLEQWILRRYDFDKKRDSYPFERWVFQALRLAGSQKIVFAADQDKNKALTTAEYVFKNEAALQELKKKELSLRGLRAKGEAGRSNPVFKPKRDCFASLAMTKRMLNKQVNIAYLCAKNALRSLIVTGGIYAGLPWFFQFWRRDEAVCLKALAGFMPQAAKDIFWREWKHYGQIDHLTDDFGWLIKRLIGFRQKKIFSNSEFKEVKNDLKIIISKLGDDLSWHESKETWMDSLDRSGAPLEMQALKLQMYKLLAGSSVFLRNNKYANIEKNLRNKVKKHFWNGQILADRIELDQKTADFTIRPNIFLAVYIYPDLLTKKERVLCFKNILPKLWLNWGGLATVDKTHPSFQIEHTGEPALSYHQGDSWFYLNNLAALVLFRTDPKMFKKYVNKILQASTQEILWQGIIGHHGELSSAGAFKSQGCLAQGWSSAMYIEMVDAVCKG